MEAHVLLIHCPDQPGLVHRVTGILFGHQLNVISNGEFVERKDNQFFMRTEFSGQVDAPAIIDQLRAILPPTSSIRLTPRKKRDVVLLATREHHCLGDLLIRHAFGELEANVKAVISNYDHLRPLTEKFDVPFHFISTEGRSREEHEQALLAAIEPLAPEYLVLAKYMRVLTPEFVSRFTNRIINIHHSFLPAFAGANPYGQAYERGVKIIGATAHFVNQHLDEGPIIAQNVIPVAHTHSVKEMAQAGRDVEKIVLARSLKLVLEERVFVYRNRTVIFD